MIPEYKYLARVKEVEDGDTVVLTIDLGFSVYHNVSVRLKDINSPEIKTTTKEAGEKSKEFLKSLLPVGTQVLVETEKTKTYRYKKSFDRYIGTVTLESGQNVADLMVESGFAERV